MSNTENFSGQPNSILIHASAVHKNGAALVFLGPSGVGKSTICHLLSHHFEPLADDAVRLTSQNEQGWIVVNGNNSSITDTSSEVQELSSNGPLLRGIFRIFQTPTTRLESISRLETCRYLIDAFFEAQWQRSFDTNTKKKALSRLAIIARSVPGYQLYFNISPQVSRTIEWLFGAAVAMPRLGHLQ